MTRLLFYASLFCSFFLIQPTEYFDQVSALIRKDKHSGRDEWLDDLQRFREALSSGDRSIVKGYFDFPISDPGNDIWYIVDMRLASTLDEKKVKPFENTDFDKYYSELLGIDFRKTLDLVDINLLAKGGSTQTKKIEVVSGSKSYMKSTYNISKKLLTLEIISEGAEFGRYSFQYHFRIINNTSIRFKDMTFSM